jgi:hypothetical protein
MNITSAANRYPIASHTPASTNQRTFPISLIDSADPASGAG